MSVLHHYNILYSIGSGSSSTVWLAYKLDNQLFYAIKVQNPEDYKAGKEEITFALKLPKEPKVFNNVIEYFDYVDSDNNKYLCSVWNLHCCSVDTLLRKGHFKSGFNEKQLKNIMLQLTTAVSILHNKFNVFHGDLKTDNILVKGVNSKDKYVINRYLELDFQNKYIKEKKIFWESLGKKPETINRMPSKDKLMLRKIIHKEIMTIIMNEIKEHNVSYSYNNNDLISISLSDFGTVCDVDDSYISSFGTRYYMAPEIILMGKCKLPVDIWALGCIMFELATCDLLFNPIKDHNFSRDYYHLKLIEETCEMFPNTFLSKTQLSKKFFYNNSNRLYNCELFDSIVIPGSRLKRKLNEYNLDSIIIKYIEPILCKTLIIEPNKRCNINELILLLK
jgi:serine/threonine-protein kinase SRPK3